MCCIDVPEDADVPTRLLCPIKYSIFKDPVIFPADGRTYEREAIEEWIAKSSSLPFGGSFDQTNPALTNLIPNMYVRDAVTEFNEEYDCKQKEKKQKRELDGADSDEKVIDLTPVYKADRLWR
jgi:hypothetical protein